jgi:hypothetical protein
MSMAVLITTKLHWHHSDVLFNCSKATHDEERGQNTLPMDGTSERRWSTIDATEYM